MKNNSPSCWVALFTLLISGPAFAAERQTELSLSKIKAPNNTISDPEYGVAMMYPTGWNVKRAIRWGENNSKTSIVLERTRPSGAAVTLFYQRFGGETQRTPEIKDWFRTMFREKEAAQQKDLPDYRNDPRSLDFGATAGGLPKCSYTANFTRGSRSVVEYFLRVAGEKTYVMLVTQGSPDQIEAMRGDIEQMADTLSLP